MSNLTAKQRRLVDAMADPECESVSAAGRKAGYLHVGSTFNTLKSKDVLEAIEQRKLELAEIAKNPPQSDKTLGELRLSKLEQEVGILEAKRLALQPDESLEGAQTVRNEWTHTLRHVLQLGHDTAAADMDSKLERLADEVETWLVEDQAHPG